MFVWHEPIYLHGPWDRREQPGRGCVRGLNMQVWFTCGANVCLCVYLCTCLLICDTTPRGFRGDGVFVCLFTGCWFKIKNKNEATSIFCEAKALSGWNLSGLFWIKLHVSFKLLQLSCLLFVSIVLALQSCQSHLSACGFLPAMRFGSGERPLSEPLQRCVVLSYALMVMISFWLPGDICQVIIMAMDISDARWFPVSYSHSYV